MSNNTATATIRLGVDLASLQSGLRQAATIAEQNGQSIKAALIRSTDEASTRIASGLKGAFTLDGAIGKAGLAIAGLGAGVGIGALIMQFNKAVDSVAALKDMSEQTGASVQSLSAISAVAKITGMDMESLGGALGKLAVNMEATGGPSEKVRDALNRIGLSAKDMAGLDTGAMFIKIAEAMNKYEDSGVKAAVATEIFGKQGRTLLPLFNDMAEAGTLAAKTTAEQAEAADAFDKNLKRLQISQDSLFKSISMEVLPAANAFVEALTAASASSDGLRGSVDGLAEDGSIQAWSESAAVGLALVIDSLDVLQRGFQVTGKFMGAQAAQIALLLQGEFKAAGQVMSEYYADYEKIANKSYLSGRLQDRLGAGASAAAVSGALNKPLLDSSAAQAGDKAGEAFLQGLRSRIKKTEFGEYAQLIQQADEKRVGAAAAPLIDQLKRLDEARAVQSYRDSLATQNIELEYQASLIGKTATEVALLNVQHKAELDLKKQIEQIERTKGSISAQSIAEMQAAMEASVAIQQASVTSRLTVERRWETGASKAFKDYTDNAGNAAKGVEQLFSNAFKGMEDALVQFAMTGQLNFTNLANGIISDIIRMQAQAATSGLISYLGKTLGNMFLASSGSTDGDTRLDNGGAMSNIDAPSANGNAFSGSPSLSAYSNTVQTSPKYFNYSTLHRFANGGVFAEAGPEAVMPLTRMGNGKLGVQATGGNTTVNVINQMPDSEAKTRESTDAMGNKTIDVIITEIVNKGITAGKFNTSMASAFNLKRAIS